MKKPNFDRYVEQQLDELRARALAIRRSSAAAREHGIVAEPPAPYFTDPK